MDVAPEVLDAIEIAREARTRAHAPYSKFKVGAALRIAGQARAIGGCNVENASYGATICAERNAIVAAVALHGPIQPEFLVVFTDEDNATPPCALCLQVIAEVAGDDLPIYLANFEGVRHRYTLGEVLPHPFRSFTPGSR